jgi:sugar fermentation stimulation protein A
MRISGVVEGRFYKRLTRFSCLVEVKGELTSCFLPNPGRLQELLVEGRELLLLPGKHSRRKTPYDLFAIRSANTWVVVDSRIPNFLVYEALRKEELPEFAGYDEVRKEPLYGSSRFDFLLQGREKTCFLEVKSCTLVKRGVALFPDAPTVRGRRHLAELLRARREGNRACILFLVQRDDAGVFSPNDAVDKGFGVALREAVSGGVEALAYASSFDGRRIRISRKVPVVL